MNKKIHTLLRLIILIGTAVFLIAVSEELYNIASGTGNWIGEFSFKWGFLFAIFATFLIFSLIILWFSLWRYDSLEPFIKNIISLRQKTKLFSWLIAIILLMLPVWFFQYSLWGLVFTGIYFRLFIWTLLIIFLAILFTRTEKRVISWQALLAGILLSGASFTLASAFSNVKDYPFNLYWSEGNRLWDYSIMFGRHLYNYPVDQPLKAFISSGRQFLWGLPFLLPNTTILFNRFWSALVLSFPYAILGWVVFKAEQGKKHEWLLIGIWAFVFLNQGPIYTPLVLSAILVAIAWRRPLWIAIPLVAFAGYYAEVTRYTWGFAPAIWAGMLEISGIKLKGARLTLRHWGRAIALTLAGVSVWYLLPIVQKIWTNENLSSMTETVSGVQGSLSKQPLLWYRLLPNDTYPTGVLGGLLIAILPITILLIYLLKKKYWQPSLWQKLVILGSLFSFLIVGLIISTKIGGGNNLHNLDMFLIALLFVTAIAWRNGGKKWLSQSGTSPLWVKTTLILLLLLPAFSFVRGLYPRLSLTPAEILQVETLTNYNPLTSPQVVSMPSDEEIQEILDYIGETTKIADAQGDVLFIDHRQLLTFGYIPRIRLVPEYEKKRLMNEALTGNSAYFAPYYQDLSDQRFSLIITEPLKIYIKDKEGIFAEENDAWTNWVSVPTLCFYEPVMTQRDVQIQVLIPRQDTSDCNDLITQ